MQIFNHHVHAGINALATAILGLSTLGAGMSLAEPSTAADQITWLIRLVFGGMLLLNGYFIKKTAKQFETQISRTRTNSESIRTLTQIARVVLTAMVAGTAGDPEVGRRKGDPLLATLLREIEAIEENNVDRSDNS